MPHSLLVFTRAQDYTAEMFEISDDEYDFEILRRVSIFLKSLFFIIFHN